MGRRRTIQWLCLAACLGLAGGRVLAYAPDYNALTPITEEPRGFGHGAFRLLPNLDMSFYYDSNVYYSAAAALSDYYLQIKPSLELKFKNPTLEAGGKYLFIRDNYFRQTAQSANSHLVNGSATLFPQGRLAFTANSGYSRSPDLADTEIVERVQRVQRNYGARARYQKPGNGFGGSLGYQFYDEEFGTILEVENRRKHIATLEASTRFLPKTQAVADFSFEDSDYPKMAGTRQRFYRGLVGVTGLLTSRMNISLKLGLSYMDPELSPRQRTFLTIAVLNEAFTSHTSVRLGYMRESQSAVYGAGRSENHVLCYIDHKLLRRLESQLRFDYYDIEYGASPLLIAPRDDQLYRGALRLSIQLHPKIKGFVEYNVEARDSNAQNPVIGGASADFVRHRVGLGASFYY